METIIGFNKWLAPGNKNYCKFCKRTHDKFIHHLYSENDSTKIHTYCEFCHKLYELSTVEKAVQMRESIFSYLSEGSIWCKKCFSFHTDFRKKTDASINNTFELIKTSVRCNRCNSFQFISKRTHPTNDIKSSNTRVFITKYEKAFNTIF